MRGVSLGFVVLLSSNVGFGCRRPREGGYIPALARVEHISGIKDRCARKVTSDKKLTAVKPLHNCDTQGLDNININYRQGRQGRRRRRRRQRSRCDDQLSVSSFASAESTGTDVVASIVKTPLPKHTDFSTLLVRWHDVAQRLGRERETEMEKQTSPSGSRSGSRSRSQLRRIGPCCAESESKLRLDSGGSGRQSRLKVLYYSWIDRIHFCFFPLPQYSRGAQGWG